MQQFFSRLRATLLLMLGLCMLSTTAFATHIRAGEITARRTDSQKLEYEITLWGYTDTNSEVVFGSNGTLDFGDGTSVQPNNTGDPNSPNYIERTRLDERTWMYKFKVKHTYPSARAYTLSFREFYRNEGIFNMHNSVNMPFYVETTLVIDPLSGVNSTPVMKSAPIDIALVGKTFHHQPQAFDPDGDSLSFALTWTRQDRNLPVANYRFPQATFPLGDPRNGQQELGGNGVFSINPVTGDIVWDSPGTKGEYNVAFWVKEWRKVRGKYTLIGKVMRDMLIIVEEAEGAPYIQLQTPFSNHHHQAPAAGEPVEWTITAQATSPTDSVILEIWGDFLKRTNAVVSNSSVRAKGEASITIQWTGEEEMGQHYQLIAKAYNPAIPGLSRNRNTILYFNENVHPLGITDHIADLPVRAFPNPAPAGKFYVKLPEANGKQISIQVYDMKGLLVYQEANVRMQEAHPVELPQAKKGMYMLLLQHNGQVYRNKLIIQ